MLLDSHNRGGGLVMVRTSNHQCKRTSRTGEKAILIILKAYR